MAREPVDFQHTCERKLKEIYLRVCLEFLAQFIQLFACERRSRPLLVRAQFGILRLLVFRLGSSSSRACT
jgi:hypothetical protein